MTMEAAQQRSPRDTVAFVATLSGALLVYNSAAHLVPGYNALYVPMNLVATVASLFFARWFGLARAELGLESQYAGRGARLGLAIAVAAALALAVAAATPRLSPVLDDARVAGIGPGLVAYRTLVRVPLGTALFEEVAFRGVLLGAWGRLTSLRTAAAASSLVFGLWHVRPTIDLLDANGLAGNGLARLGLVAAAIGVTAAAGYVFCLMRLRSRSLVAPLIAHAAINSLAILAAYSITA